MGDHSLTSRRSKLSRRGLRLASGTVLFVYVATHLANHAVGLVSLAAAEGARLWFIAFWRSLPLTALFYAALAVHIVLAFAALYERRTLRMPPVELARLALGFCIPFFLAGHFAGTRLAYELYGQDDRYVRVVWAIWSSNRGFSQLALMCVAWVHGCIGVHFVLRQRAPYRRHIHLVFTGAVLLPVLAALGFTAMAREISLRAVDPIWFDVEVAAANLLDSASRTALRRAADGLWALFACALGGILLARAWRSWKENRSGLAIALAYPGRVLRVPRGWSVLEASRAHGIAHMSLCGGRARCSTCRVRISGDAAHCPPPSPVEERTLRRIGARSDVRLACQLRPTGDIGVTPLLSPSAAEAQTTDGQFSVEREVAVLFIDLRRWTTLSERTLPHDLTYVLDHFFAAVGAAVREAGGIPNQFIGDSVMAIFGMDTDCGAACRQAVSAARGIEARMQSANERMRREFGHTLEFGIGIDAGRAAVGEVGYQETRTFTAVGDPVNTASRLQELCKQFGVRLVMSERVAMGAGLDTSALDAHTIEVRGRSSRMRIYAVASPGTLPLGAA
jgi:adenylate cyclase